MNFLFLLLSLNIHWVSEASAAHQKAGVGPSAPSAQKPADPDEAYEKTDLYDLKTQMRYQFRELHEVHVHPGEKETFTGVYDRLKSQLADKKEPLKNTHGETTNGSPETILCVDRLSGKMGILTDMVENEYDVCEFKDGSKVLAWDLLKFIEGSIPKKKNPTSKAKKP